MGLPKSGDAASRFSAYVEGLASVIGHADRGKTASRLLRGADDALRAKERRADGGDYRA
jgi:hypothetical protein